MELLCGGVCLSAAVHAHPAAAPPPAVRLPCSAVPSHHFSSLAHHGGIFAANPLPCCRPGRCTCPGAPLC